MIINPILYCLSSASIPIIVSQYLAQYTNKERHIVDMIKIKFGLLNLTFYVCWLPNIANAIIIFTSWNDFPEKVIVALWYIMVSNQVSYQPKYLFNLFLALWCQYSNLKYFVFRFRQFSILCKLFSIRWFMANQPLKSFVFGDLRVNILIINIMKKHLFYFEETIIPPMLWKIQTWFCKCIFCYQNI